MITLELTRLRDRAFTASRTASSLVSGLMWTALIFALLAGAVLWNGGFWLAIILLVLNGLSMLLAAGMAILAPRLYREGQDYQQKIHEHEARRPIRYG